MSVANGRLILAIDAGSSSVRAMLFDQQGNAVDGVFEQVQYRPDNTPDGGSTIDPELIVDYISTCIDQVLQQAGDAAGQIGAVVMDTLVSNLMAIDAQNKPLTPIYTWADTRGGDLAGDFILALQDSGLSVADYIAHTGCRIHTSYWPLRLQWIAQNQPDLLHSATHWITFGEFLLIKLFDQRVISYSAASWSGLLNRHTLAWDESILAAIGLRLEQLSIPSDDPVRGLRDDWARRWPVLRDVPWFPAVADGAASNIGGGCTTPAHVAISVGTSGAMRIVVPGVPDTVPDGLFAYRVDQNRSLVGSALSNAGNLFAWMRRTLILPDSEELEAQVAATAPDSHGLTLLPFLAGERAPGWNPHAQAVFMGMTQDTTPVQIVRAGLESIAYRFAQIAQRLAPLLPADSIYVASGNAILSSPAWLQIMADVLNAPVYSAAERESTIRGAVFMATGNAPALDFAASQRYLPNAAAHAIYGNAIARQKALYAQVMQPD